jgi:hypothetical protein
MSPIWTGILITPPVVTEVVTEMVRVGDVVLLSEDTVTPAGFVISDTITLQGTCEEPCMAMIWVVVVPALAALVVPGKAWVSEVRMTEYASVTSTIEIWSTDLIAIENLLSSFIIP